MDGGIVFKFSIAMVSATLILATEPSVARSGETEDFLNGVAIGVTVGGWYDSHPVPYNNYGNFNTLAYGQRSYQGYDDPTRYRPVCQRYLVEIEDPYSGVIFAEKTECSIEYIQ